MGVRYGFRFAVSGIAAVGVVGVDQGLVLGRRPGLQRHVTGAIWHPRGCGSSDLKAKGQGLCDLGITFGLHLATHGVHFPTLCPLWGGALEPLTHLMKKASKKVPN